ncbi:Lactaldehyde dehydrogenase, Succinate semialdehyde dehydrogenase NAD-dependent aldehyde dehydrogenase [Halanaeroarchaeum sp. HSR-CO]|uniref:aldehyde dehydrogenase family protein n=1 Tax=Halanaeroarchaeum sp. HSR-CO TaxID=2866382 RepID=UPI00217F1878|nr:aldehyde dehydrogenase family protein [Halanaeroarchaeum sp. HSR-CO]UWG46818.1 Lactaldehyde dehydrogenase, Succinate semialdehyde dehydrogenase NAD-dependent aldehyde dehydrogenase [Halanaeroarchaeum sp. HSR-CO]
MEPAPFENELTFQTHRAEGAEESVHDRYESAVESLLYDLGDSHPLRIGGEAVEREKTFTVTSPGDHDELVGEFAAGDADAVESAVDAASAAFDDWRGDWERRVEIFRSAAGIMRDRKYDLAATMTVENGKNRTEALADVDEAIDFLRFYSRELERNEGYVYDTGEPTPDQHTGNRLVPYGVFAVVSPFNFPLAILTGMTSGALLAGNTVVVKPASTTPLIAHQFVDILEEAGIPDGVVNLVTGGGRDVGQPLVEHEDVAGVAFTGSRAVGLGIQETFFELGKRGPVIAELGGKNPVIVSENADLEKAVSGVLWGAFSFSGQKCSATSRVYVDASLYDRFVTALVEATEDLEIGRPRDRETDVSPIIDDGALERYREITDQARSVGTVRTGGTEVEREDLPDGRYVEPTVVTDVPHEHELAREEHFLPFVTVHEVSDFEEALEKSNDSDYGLCAGLFSEDGSEVEDWFDGIEAGMCYVNRSQSATTGALVQAQPFGGWKFSGTTGKFAGGYWYLPQFMREQTRTVVGDVGDPTA